MGDYVLENTQWENSSPCVGKFTNTNVFNESSNTMDSVTTQQFSHEINFLNRSGDTINYQIVGNTNYITWVLHFAVDESIAYSSQCQIEDLNAGNQCNQLYNALVQCQI